MAATEQEQGELQAENELLLLQLHQVQEELERYYLAYRKLQKGGTSMSEHPSSGVNAYSTRKPAFSPALLERINQSEIIVAESNKAVNTELQKKHQAYLEQLQQNQELRSTLQEQGDELQALEVKLQEKSTLSAQLSKQQNILESQLNELKEEKEGKLNALIEHNQALSQNNQEIRKSNSMLQEKIVQVSTSHQQSEQRAEALKIELAERAREIRLGQKMLAKAQVDLDHLREQYSQKSQSEQELIDLVRELKTKLEVASRYYFQIQQEYPELLNARNQQKSQ